jgi:hypothetical protein
MNLMKMIIVMFLHCASGLALLCQLSTKDLLAKVLGDPLRERLYSLLMYRLFLHQKLIGSAEALHLLGITAQIGVVFLRQRAIAMLDLLRRSMRRQAQHGQGLLALQNREHRISAALPEQAYA